MTEAVLLPSPLSLFPSSAPASSFAAKLEGGRGREREREREEAVEEGPATISLSPTFPTDSSAVAWIGRRPDQGEIVYFGRFSWKEIFWGHFSFKKDCFVQWRKMDGIRGASARAWNGSAVMNWKGAVLKAVVSLGDSYPDRNAIVKVSPRIAFPFLYVETTFWVAYYYYYHYGETDVNCFLEGPPRLHNISLILGVLKIRQKIRTRLVNGILTVLWL